MGKQVWQVDGLRVSIAKRILIYAFGKHDDDGYFFKITVDQKKKEFLVWMINKVGDTPINMEDLEYFKEHFYGFNFIVIDPEKCDTV